MNKLFTFLLFLPFFSVGQDHILSIEGGYSYSQIHPKFKTTGIVKPKNLYYGAINYEFHPENWFYFSLGARFDQKGFELGLEPVYKNEDGMVLPTDSNVFFNSNSSYLSIPIKFGFQFGKQFFGFFAGGVMPSFLVNTNLETTTLYFNFEEKSKAKSWDHIKYFDLPLIAEIGIGAELSEIVLLRVSASYTYSLMNQLIPYSNPTDLAQNSKVSPINYSGVHAGISLLFRLKKKETQKRLEKFTPSN